MPRPARRHALIVVAAALTAGVSAGIGYSAFFQTTSTTGSTYASGTVILSNSSTGAALVSLTNAVPTLSSDTDTGCLKVTYTGSLPASVRLYATVGGNGLASYVNLTVTRGTFSPSDPAYRSCTNFTADATTYISGQAAGVVYTGTLAAFPASYAAGLVDPTAGSPRTWTTGESHVYKLVVNLQDNLAARGLNATATFKWEARNT